MIQVIAWVVGIYLILDTFVLAVHAVEENRYCQIAKYSGAAMSGGYLLVEPINDVTFVMGMTIALFMWPDAWYRFISFVEMKAEWLYVKYVQRFGLPFRRKTDR
jgi:hypothetical protein